MLTTENYGAVKIFKKEKNLMSWSRWEEVFLGGVPRHQMRHNINRDREDDRAVVFCRNAVQGLQIAQLGRNKDEVIIEEAEGDRPEERQDCP